jgi:hypothetical protein
MPSRLLKHITQVLDDSSRECGDGKSPIGKNTAGAVDPIGARRLRQVGSHSLRLIEVDADARVPEPKVL